MSDSLNCKRSLQFEFFLCNIKVGFLLIDDRYQANGMKALQSMIDIKDDSLLLKRTDCYWLGLPFRNFESL